MEFHLMVKNLDNPNFTSSTNQIKIFANKYSKVKVKELNIVNYTTRKVANQRKDLIIHKTSVLRTYQEPR